MVALGVLLSLQGGGCQLQLFGRTERSIVGGSRLVAAAAARRAAARAQAAAAARRASTLAARLSARASTDARGVAVFLAISAAHVRLHEWRSAQTSAPIGAEIKEPSWQPSCCAAGGWHGAQAGSSLGRRQFLSAPDLMQLLVAVDCRPAAGAR